MEAQMLIKILELHQRTLLYYVEQIQNCKVELLKYLIELGVDASTINDEGENALMKYLEFCENPSIDVFQFLINEGSNVN